VFRKFAKLQVLEVKSAAAKVADMTLSAFDDLGDYKTDDGFLYVRVRAISSRVNKNNDGWPAAELKKSYRTFVGKPLFVDHHNSDPRKARGVVVDAALHEDDDTERTAKLDPYYASAPAEHLPATWIELLLEVDAKRFPKLAKAVIDGDIDGVSMGANVERSKCSHCGNWATSPEEYCQHVRSKGAYFDRRNPDGTKTSARAYEDCYDIGFFELSFVFDPADETALISEKRLARRQAQVEVYAEEYGPRTAMRRVAAARREAGFEDWSPEEAATSVDPARFYAVTDTNNFYENQPTEGFATRDEGLQWAQSNEPTLNDDMGAIMSGQEIIDAVTQVAAEYPMKPGPYDQEADVGMGLPDDPRAEPAEEPAAEVPAMEADGGETAWKVEQLTRAGLDPESAERVAIDPSADWRAIVKALEGGADPATAVRLASQLAWIRPVTDDEFMFAEKGSVRTADLQDSGQNPPPQSEMTTAPEEVDTLRQDKVCPICGSDMEDGICEVCNYEEPPEGFDNPDLEKAKETDLKDDQEDAQAAAQEQGVAPGGPAAPSPGEGPQSGAAGAPGMVQPVQSSYALVSAAPAFSKSAASVTSGRTNTQERPILPATRKLTDRPKNQTTVKDPKKPVESNRKESDMTETTLKTADGATPVGEGVAADKRVDVEGVGAVTGDPLSGIDHENVEKDTGDFTAPDTDTWSGEEGDSLPAADGVTSEVSDNLFSVASADKTAEVETINEGNESAAGFPDHDPAHVDLEALLAEEVGDRTETDSTGTAFRSLEQAAPVTHDGEAAEGGPIGETLASVEAAKEQIFKAVKVAEAEVGLGLTDADQKMERVAELESSSAEALDATLETLARVKTAGLRRPTSERRTAGRMPSLQRVASVGDSSGFLVEAAASDAQVDSQVEDAVGW